MALVRAAAKGDPAAQTALVERLAALVRYACRRLSRSSIDAEDAAQSALLEILRSTKNFRFETGLESWAYRITVRTVLRSNRRERRRAETLDRWLLPGRLPWGTPLERSPESPGVTDAFLMRLSFKRREVFVLRHAFGYSVSEIAELTGTPPGTVKDRLVTARKQLLKMIARDELGSGER
jgi:RNA polymerase sigma-70 factor (ECF subfamily)